jgi:hypothetical protein
MTRRTLDEHQAAFGLTACDAVSAIKAAFVFA